MKRKVSVVIPTYNYGRFIGEAIESVLAQSFPVFEIIVVDDGSNDDTEQVAARFGERVKYIKQKNGGVSQARNNGARQSTGDLIAFLDADDVWLPKKIEKQVAKFSENSEVGLVHCSMREYDTATGATICFYAEGEEGWVADDLLLFEKPTVNVSGSSVMVSRKAFEAVGGFDARKEMHPSEDWEFCYRVARIFKVAFVREVMIDYRNHGGNGHLKIPKFERAMLLAFEKTFRDAAPEVQKLKRRSYGNLHKIFAGSYFQIKQYDKFLEHSMKSCWLTPHNIAYFAKFPLRKLKKSKLEVK